jgi:outer membrane protein assembly factor BamB
VETGDVLWARTLTGTLTSVLAFDDRVYVGSTDNFLYCLSSHEGRIDWQWRTGGDLVGLPVVDERRLYFVSLDNVLRALDRRSGAQRWLRPLPLRPTTGPVRADDDLIVSGVSPMLRAYAIRDGRPSGQMDAPGDLAAPPHVVQSEEQTTLIVLTRDVAKGTIMTALGRAGDQGDEKDSNGKEQAPDPPVSPEPQAPDSPR